MRILALIPARGGSKAVERKNLTRVGGRTLLGRTIAHALATEAIDAVYVTTEDAEVAAVARVEGAQVLDRPVGLSGDTATTESAVAHALGLWRQRGCEPDVIVLLQCTSPFRSAGQLQAALAHFDASGCDSLLSVTPFHHFIWVQQQRALGYRAMTYDPRARPRRQDIDEIYCETGSFYIFRPELLDATGSRLGGHIEIFSVPGHDAMEIDEPADVLHARLLAQGRADPARGDLGAIEWLVLDVDGTLTDGAMYYSEAGDVVKRFDTRDGFGLRLWQEAGGQIAWISGEASEAVARRARKLGVHHVALGITDKRAELRRLKRAYGLSRTQVLAMGDDLNDLPMADESSLFVAPADAQPAVLARADVVTASPGGHGAVRELVDLLLRAREQRGAADRSAA
ncbi:MAG: HAD hydrolase family protein [Nannocystaceae bacterium]